MSLPFTPFEIQKIRRAAQFTASLFSIIDDIIQPGVSTLEINDVIEKAILDAGAYPAPLEKGFPKAVCTSVNEVICHGIPCDKPLKKGDIVNIDISLRLDNAYGDTSKMYCIGEVAPFAKRLVDLTQEALYTGIRAVKPGEPIESIGIAIEKFCKKHNLSIVQEFCGHGIGLELHAQPQIVHYAQRPSKNLLMPGMIFTIEPMLNLGRKELKILQDGWTAVTRDRSLSAQWEHMILVTSDGYEILTLRSEEKFFSMKS